MIVTAFAHHHALASWTIPSLIPVVLNVDELCKKLSLMRASLCSVDVAHLLVPAPNLIIVK
jgi:hypothetical protein